MFTGVSVVYFFSFEQDEGHETKAPIAKMKKDKEHIHTSSSNLLTPVVRK